MVCCRQPRETRAVLIRNWKRQLVDAPAAMKGSAARHTVCVGEEKYPQALLRLSAPPQQLRVGGALPRLEHAVAIVGTRAADEEAQRFAHNLAQELALNDCVVVSGGARGIDAAAHRGALAADGQSIAVFAGGLDRPFPKGHAAMFRDLRKRGAVVSELSDDICAQPFSFLQRNRLIAALSRAVVVVQAPDRSGALSTARHAQEMNIPVFAVPAPPWDPRGGGVRSLLKRGALLCDDATDILRLLHPDDSKLGRQSRRTNGRPVQVASALRSSESGDANLSPAALDEAGVVLRALGARPRHPDELSVCTGLPLRVVQSLLLELELQGRVTLCVGGRYVVGC